MLRTYKHKANVDVLSPILVVPNINRKCRQPQ